MKHETMIVLEDGVIAEEVSNTYGVQIDYIASLFWDGDYTNDSYKSLWIEEEADEEFKYSWQKEEDVKMRNLVRAHLRKCFPNVERVLVDVTW